MIAPDLSRFSNVIALLLGKKKEWKNVQMVNCEMSILTKPSFPLRRQKLFVPQCIKNVSEN